MYIRFCSLAISCLLVNLFGNMTLSAIHTKTDRNTIDELNKEIDELKLKIGKQTSTNKLKINELSNELIEKNKEYKVSLKNKDSIIREKEEKITKIENEKNQLSLQLQKKTLLVNDFNQKISDITNENNNLKTKLNDLEDNIYKQKSINLILNNNINDINDEINRFKNENNKLQNTNEILTKNIKKSNDERDRFKNENNELKKTNKLLTKNIEKSNKERDRFKNENYELKSSVFDTYKLILNDENNRFERDFKNQLYHIKATFSILLNTLNQPTINNNDSITSPKPLLRQTTNKILFQTNYSDKRRRSIVNMSKNNLLDEIDNDDRVDDGSDHDGSDYDGSDHDVDDGNNLNNMKDEPKKTKSIEKYSSHNDWNPQKKMDFSYGIAIFIAILWTIRELTRKKIVNPNKKGKYKNPEYIYTAISVPTR